MKKVSGQKGVDRSTILLVDDDETQLELLTLLVEGMGYGVERARSGSAAIALCERGGDFGAILIDQTMPGMSGLETYEKLQSFNVAIPCIIITGQANVPDAVMAIRLGVYDYLQKPVGAQQLELALRRALTLSALSRENERLKRLLQTDDYQGGIVTGDPKLKKVIERATRVAKLDSNILITGESGTGKELIARLVHDKSPRSKKAFIAINCAAFTEDLLASALFGFEKGAFTGAAATTKGCFEEADGGTLFLDEIGDMSPQLQSSLLRVVQEREFCRVGSFQPIKVNVRLLAATNRDLEEAVRNQTFREDLYFRLNVIPLPLPPLRERRGDVPLLIRYFIDLFNERLGASVSQIEPDAMRQLVACEWSGNCRELMNTIEYLVALRQEGSITVSDLPERIHSAGSASDGMGGHGHTEEAQLFKVEKEAFESDYFRRAWKKAEGNITRMARQTGISRPNLYEKIRKYKLKE